MKYCIINPHLAVRYSRLKYAREDYVIIIEITAYFKRAAYSDCLRFTAKRECTKYAKTNI